MISSSGKLHYGPSNRLVVWVDQSISDYYRSLLPKAWYVRPQYHRAHITVVRNGKENPVNMEHWGKYEGEIIPFEYEPRVYWGQVYYFLRVQSKRIGDIREELGMPRYRGGAPQDVNCYHITVGNVKDALQ